MSKRSSQNGRFAVIADRAAVCGPWNIYQPRIDASEAEEWFQERLAIVLAEESAKEEERQLARDKFVACYYGHTMSARQSSHSVHNMPMGKCVPRRSRRRVA